MRINGIASVIYGVEDVALSTKFFEDFGLPLTERATDSARFDLEEGSSVIIRPLSAAQVPGQKLVGLGAQQIIWGVENQESFNYFVGKLRNVTDISIDSAGTAHFLDVDGIGMGLRIYPKRLIWAAPDPINCHSNIQRLNTHRKWRTRAFPKTIQHVVFQTPKPSQSWEWYRDNLNFKLSDVQEDFGIFARASGCTDHHNIYWLRADLPFPGLDGKVRFNHVNYGVEDLDEIMIGANYMQRRGWDKSLWGLGRHRIASSLFMYLPCPAGGEAEYGADSDHINDSWVPRHWNPNFGTMSFMHNLQPWILDEAAWEVKFVDGTVPSRRGKQG